MTLDQSTRRAVDELVALRITRPAWDDVAARARRQRRRSRIALSVALVILAVVIAVPIALLGGTDDTHEIRTPAGLPGPVPDVDAVPVFLWVDSNDVNVASDLGDRFEDAINRNHLSSGTPADCGNLFLRAGRYDQLEDLDQVRADGYLYDQLHPSALAGNRSVPTGPPSDDRCDPRVTDAIVAVSDVMLPLQQEWIAAVAGLEKSDAGIAAARETRDACFRDRGYPLVPTWVDRVANPDRPGDFVSDGWFIENRATLTDADSRRIGNDFADCMTALVAARTAARSSARDAFVAAHSAELDQLQRALDRMLAVVFAVPKPADATRDVAGEAQRALDEQRRAGEERQRADEEQLRQENDRVLAILNDPATTLPADVPRCTAEDLQFRGARVDAMFVFVQFAPRTGPECALLSYPSLSGLDADGAWVPIPTTSQTTAPVSSYEWTGRFSETVPGHPWLLLRLQVLPAPADTASQCPGGEVDAQHFSALRLELREGGGSVELDVPFDVGGCGLAMSRFGYDSTDTLSTP